MALKARIADLPPFAQLEDFAVYTADATEFGADRTGARDSTAEIQRAIDACEKAEGGTVYLPGGRYKVLGRLSVPGGVTLRGVWASPDSGGLGKGTILMAYAGRGDGKLDGQCFLRVHSGACVRDLSVWYPEQRADSPVPYPATIRGSGHTTVFNLTLYNSWCGFWNNDCSSMLIRRMYGTPLKLGIHGAYAYDIPRIEHVRFSPRYWAGSGLAGAPKGKTLDADILIVKSLTGVAVATLPYRGTHASIEKIPAGIYQVCSLNRKGITHRLGYLEVKRR